MGSRLSPEKMNGWRGKEGPRRHPIWNEFPIRLKLTFHSEWWQFLKGTSWQMMWMKVLPSSSPVTCPSHHNEPTEKSPKWSEFRWTGDEEEEGALSSSSLGLHSVLFKQWTSSWLGPTMMMLLLTKRTVDRNLLHLLQSSLLDTHQRQHSSIVVVLFGMPDRLSEGCTAGEG